MHLQGEKLLVGKHSNLQESISEGEIDLSTLPREKTLRNDSRFRGDVIVLPCELILHVSLEGQVSLREIALKQLLDREALGNNIKFDVASDLRLE